MPAHKYNEDLMVEKGLALCEVCRGGEGELTTECPGREMTDEELEKSYAGKLDYSNGTWWPCRIKMLKTGRHSCTEPNF